MHPGALDFLSASQLLSHLYAHFCDLRFMVDDALPALAPGSDTPNSSLYYVPQNVGNLLNPLLIVPFLLLAAFFMFLRQFGAPPFLVIPCVGVFLWKGGPWMWESFGYQDVFGPLPSMPWWLVVAVILSVVVFYVLALLGRKYFHASKLAVERMESKRFEEMIRAGGYNRARVMKTGAALDGNITLRYPKLFINDVSFDLTDAFVHPERPDVLVLRDMRKNDLQVCLYRGATDTYDQQEASPKRSKFTEKVSGTEQTESSTTPASSQRRSIFRER